MTFLPPVALRTPAFTLRPHRIGDGEALFDAVDSSREHLTPFISWVEQHSDPISSEKDARAMAGRYLLDIDFALAIVREERILGGTGFHLHGRSLALGVAEIGMWIRTSEANRGLGSKVLRAMLEWGFGDWPFERLVWRCHVDNLSSKRVAEKCGMTLEGIAKHDLRERTGARGDAYVFSALRR